MLGCKIVVHQRVAERGNKRQREAIRGRERQREAEKLLSQFAGLLLIITVVIIITEVFSVCHLHAPPPGRSVPLQWLAPQFGIASLCPYAHSLERFLRHSFLSLRRYYLVMLGLGAPLSSPT